MSHYKDYWIKRLLKNRPTHYYKHNQHGLKSSVFQIAKIAIVESSEKYLNEGVLRTEKAIKIYGELE